MVQARTLLNQLGMNKLHKKDQNHPQTELINKIEVKLQLAKNSMTEFNHNLRQDEAASDFTLKLNENYTLYYGALTSLLHDVNNDDISSFINKPAQKYQDNFEKAFESWLIDCDVLIKKGEAINNLAYERAMWLIIALLIVLPCIVFFVWRKLHRQLIVPLKHGIAHIHAIAKGELTTDIRVEVQNEMGELLAALQHMQAELVKTVSDVRSEASEMFSAASAISADYQDLSARTEQQASALVQTAASMEQFTVAVKQNGDNAAVASGLASDASLIAGEGSTVVSDVVTTMRAIAASSQRIADIISMIDGIAFQTNILALNAAVEAARAGEQGRGFAVVAGEVRNLAQITAQAAKEIKVLIEESVSRITTGASHADREGETMNGITEAVTRVNSLMKQIANASQEQGRGIDQVSLAVTDVDRVTQQNALLVEASAHTTNGLETRAERLNQAVAIFRIN